ncbi:MAG: hypothetical protein Kow00109_00040 [Acidobacteriota bacterium]
MRREEEALLGRILESRYFRQAPTLKRLLDHLCRLNSSSASPASAEYDLAVNVLRRRPDFDPAQDPVVRVNVARIRERLARYFEREGRCEKLRLVVPRGEYRAVFYNPVLGHTQLGREEVTSIWLERLWQPYLIGKPENILVYSELLFLFNTQRRVCIRHIFANKSENVADRVRAVCPGFSTRGFRPSYPYVSAGEMRCALAVCRLFSSLGVGLQPQPLSACSWKQRAQANLVLLGGPRINPLFSFYQEPLTQAGGLLQETDGFRDSRRAGEKESFPSGWWRVEPGAPFTEWVLVTRLPNLVPGRVVTLIGGNYGRAIEVAGRYLTDEDALAGTLPRLEPGLRRGFPPYFQVLLQVDFCDFGRPAGPPVPVAFRRLRFGWRRDI